MEISQIVHEQRRSYEVADKAVTEVINELQAHEKPQFDTLHELATKARTLFRGMSSVEEAAEACRVSYVQTLCGLFCGEYSQEEAVERVLASRQQLRTSQADFEHLHDASSWLTDGAGMVHLARIRGVRTEGYEPLPEIEHHSFLD